MSTGYEKRYEESGGLVIDDWIPIPSGLLHETEDQTGTETLWGDTLRI